MAEVRLSGLDDSVTQTEVAAAFAKTGECAADVVKVGEIRQLPYGGVVIVKAPVEAAKRVAKGRLLVGWVSAQVKILAPKPLRCYRCLESGHVGAQCQAVVDCSGLCYRCGQPGHKSRDCSAALHCPLCAAANKAADHKLGSKNCYPKNKKSKAAAGTPASQPSPHTEGRGAEEMDTAAE